MPAIETLTAVQQKAVRSGIKAVSIADLFARTDVVKACWLGNSLISGGGRMMQRLESLSSGRIVTIKNSGVSGRSLSGVIAAMATDIDQDADLVFVSEGSNSAVSAVAPSSYYGLMVQVVDYINSLGKVAIVCASPPRSSSASYLTRTNRYPWAEYLAARNSGGLYVDPYRLWRAPDGGWVPILTTDKTHPAVERQDAYDLAAQEIWDALNPFHSFGRRKPFLEVVSDGDNAGYSGIDNTGTDVVRGNALLLNGSAGWVNSDPTNIALTTESAAPFRGNKLVMTVTGLAADQTVERKFVVNGGAVEPLLGDVLHARAAIECTESFNLGVSAHLYGASAYPEVQLMKGGRNNTPFPAEMFDATTAPLGGTSQSKHAIIVKLSKTYNITFTATGAGDQLTVSSVAGSVIPIGCTISGPGIPTGTKIIAQVSGATGSDGVYTTSVSTTASAAACTVLATGKVSISNADLYNMTRDPNGGSVYA